MPAYEYECPDGTRFIKVVPVHQRDDVHGGIRRVLSAPVILTGATSDLDMKKGVLKGYAKAEEKDGSRFRSGYTKKQIKEAWAN